MTLFLELLTSQSIVIKSLAELVADDEADGLGKVLKLETEMMGFYSGSRHSLFFIYWFVTFHCILRGFYMDNVIKVKVVVLWGFQINIGNFFSFKLHFYHVNVWVEFTIFWVIGIWILLNSVIYYLVLLIKFEEKRISISILQRSALP